MLADGVDWEVLSRVCLPAGDRGLYAALSDAVSLRVLKQAVRISRRRGNIIEY